MVCAHLHQVTLEILAALQWFIHADLYRFADTTFKVRRFHQRPVQAWRRHLKGVLPRQGVVNIQDRADLTADLGAVIDRHALRAIDKDPQDRMMSSPGQLGVYQLEAQGAYPWLN